ncbi:carboxypeptidase regulatory-like domain-containing protein [Myxococcus sp. CA033]|uniref:carboxypeptidase-like regulatory domain-containing protein n=1 Tax=Myxococcus sp. CA033 TaxID=2741516 RepID=UPI00157B49F5|nr:carboxypeptidase-like regulatory domain-containing protein [Myxococcus sp. CA033]NTX37415.1 carboxypeptidase regulatory-like domain-containing protein [Myxococcus sp. CA033]
MRTSRKMAVTLGALTLVGALGMWHLPKPGDAPSVPRASAPRGSTGLILAPPAPRAEGTLRIQGIVVGDEGPLAGVRVTATRPEPGQTLSELPCSQVLRRHTGGSHAKFPECFFDEEDTTLELLLARQGEAPVYAEALTTEDGRFTLDNLPEGRFTLWAIGARDARLQPEVAAGTEGLQLRLGEAFFLKGQLIDEDLVPLAQVRVMAVHQGSTRFFDGETGTDGSYRMGPLPSGRYAITFAKDGWLPTLANQWPDNPLTLLRPRRITGQVLNQRSPAPNVTVSMHDVTQRRYRSPPSAMRITDKQGRFTFEELPPQSFQLSASKGEQHALAEVDLKVPGTSSEVTLVLGHAALLEGRVQDEAGAGIEGATITVRDVDNHEAASARTDAAGHYRASPLLLKPHEVEVSASRYLRIKQAIPELGPGTKRLDFTLRPTVWVDGVVLDEAGRPIPDVSIEIHEKPQAPSGGSFVIARTQSDGAGRFHLDLALPGTFTLKSRSERFAEDQRQVQAPDTNVRWVLKQGASVSGTVRDELGTPLPEVSVSLWSQEPDVPHMSETTTDPQGHYTLGGLKSGRYVLEAIHTSGAVERSASQSMELRDQEEAQADLRLAAGWTLSGIVEDTAGNPIAGAAVGLLETSESAPEWRRHQRTCEGPPVTITQADGRFTLRNLQQPKLKLGAWTTGVSFAPHLSTGGHHDSGDFLVREGAPHVRLVMKREGRVQGRVVGPDGKPITHFNMPWEVKHPRGEFSVNVDSPGSFRLNISARGMAPISRAVELHDESEVMDLGELRMSPGRQVAGRVLDAETSAPVAGATLRIAPDRMRGEPLHRLAEQVETARDGSFSLPNVEERSLTLFIEAGGYPLKQLTLAPGPQEGLAVLLDHGAKVEFSVLDARGQPTNATVYVDRDGEVMNSRYIEVPKSGLLVVRTLGPGDYQVRAISSWDRPATYALQRVQIPASGRVAITLKARHEGATLKLGVKTDDSLSPILLVGEVPLPERTNDVSELDSRGLPSQLSDSGARVFRNLPPGKVTLFLMRPNQEYIHWELIDIPEEGTVVRDVTPAWRRLKRHTP